MMTISELLALRTMFIIELTFSGGFPSLWDTVPKDRLIKADHSDPHSCYKTSEWPRCDACFVKAVRGSMQYLYDSECEHR